MSGVVTDFMQSLKPFAMVATGDTTDIFRARFPPVAPPTSSSGTCRPLTVHSMLCRGDDPLAPIRVERREYYLGGYEKRRIGSHLCQVPEIARPRIRRLQQLRRRSHQFASRLPKAPAACAACSPVKSPRTQFVGGQRRRGGSSFSGTSSGIGVATNRRPALNPSARPMTAMAAWRWRRRPAGTAARSGPLAWQPFRHRPTTATPRAARSASRDAANPSTGTMSAHGARGSRRVPINSTASALTPTRRPRCRDADVRGHRGGARPGMGRRRRSLRRIRARPMRSPDRAQALKSGWMRFPVCEL